MAAGTWPRPGTKYGPCAEPCEHIDCAATRRDAESLCRLCSQPIGYEVRFYRDPEAGAMLTYVHAACLEAQLPG